MTGTSAFRPVQSPTSDTTVPATAEPVAPVAAPAETPVARSRVGVTWVGMILFTAMLVLLLAFVLQNTQAVEISYFGATGHLSLAVAMLLAAAAGVLLTAIAGSLRIWQLRRRLRRSARR